MKTIYLVLLLTTLPISGFAILGLKHENDVQRKSIEFLLRPDGLDKPQPQEGPPKAVNPQKVHPAEATPKKTPMPKRDFNPSNMA